MMKREIERNKRCWCLGGMLKISECFVLLFFFMWSDLQALQARERDYANIKK